MPLRHKSAQKRARQTKKITEKNKSVKALIKGSVKRVTASKDKATAEEKLPKLLSSIDKLAKRSVIHKKKASNLKSKCMKRIAGL